MRKIYPGASGTLILSQNEVNVNVKFAGGFGRSPQLVREKRGRSRLSPQPELPLLELLDSPQLSAEKCGGTRLLQPRQGKPQIQSCPGVPVRQRDRYRVVLGGQILGERLTIDEALKLAKRGERNA